MLVSELGFALVSHFLVIYIRSCNLWHENYRTDWRPDNSTFVYAYSCSAIAGRERELCKVCKHSTHPVENKSAVNESVVNPNSDDNIIMSK